MADITYNGLSSPEDLLTFTEIPNIITVNEYMDGSSANFEFEFRGDLASTVTGDGQYYVTILDESVSNVTNPKEANNKRFYISSNQSFTAMSFARALRNCASLAAEFNIFSSGATVSLVSKKIGFKWTDYQNYFSTNMNDVSTYLENQATNGNVTSGETFYKGKITVDVYSADTPSNYSYITTLEKNFYDDSCSFNVSPVLSTFSEYGTEKKYSFKLTLLQDNGAYSDLGTISGTSMIGYNANQSEDYLNATNLIPLINNSRGANGSILYTYGNTIPLTVFAGYGTGRFSHIISVKDSAENQIHLTQGQSTPYGSRIIEYTNTVPESAMTIGRYVDINIGGSVYNGEIIGGQTVRFEIIKPLKAVEDYQRVLWRNEYGGISFFDFTGSRSETDNVENETYEKNIFDYYTSNVAEKKKIYKNDYSKSVQLTSHLMEKDGKYIFNSLMKSKKVWTEINNKTYAIIPTSVSVTENDSYNNVYTAKLTYIYSSI